MSLQPVPIPLAMVICDAVITDERTKKKSLIGIFSQIQTKSIPHQHSRLFIYIVLTEGSGQKAHELKCVNAKNNKSVFSCEGQLEFKDPTQQIDLLFDLSGIVFPEYGDYRFEYFCDREPIIARRFSVVDVGKQGEG